MSPELRLIERFAPFSKLLAASATEAARAGMCAGLLKYHQNSILERAWRCPVAFSASAVGVLVLNETIGGLNPAAVRVAVMLGARQVWMPTRSAATERRFQG